MDAARETGFGTGLLSHLERGRVPEDPPPVIPEAAAAAQPQVRDGGSEEGVRANQEGPAAEAAPQLEEEAPDESALPPPAAVEPVVVEPAAVERRPSSMRALVRERAEREAERVWSAFAGALDATLPDGRPDYATRLAAAQALLEVGGEAATGASQSDELAGRRARRGVQ
jgi:hypothetical protein